MSMIKPGDEVIAIQETTGGCYTFQLWAKAAISSQTVLTVDYVDGSLYFFKEVEWCLHGRDLKHFEPIQENE